MKILTILIFLLFTLNSKSQFFTKKASSIFPNNLITSDSDVGDFDNDGDFDVIIMGFKSLTSSILTQLYKNDGLGNFSISTLGLQDYFRNGQVKFIDIDNDNDLDIFIAGITASNYKATIYYNNGSYFVASSYDFTQGINMSNTQFDWDDLNNDGLIDLILSGNVDLMYDTVLMYQNTGNKTFQLIPNTFLAVSQGEIEIQDVDNDGDKDVIIGGSNLNLHHGSNTIVYRNEVLLHRCEKR